MYLFIVFKYSMISWNITQTFSTFSELCKKPGFLYLHHLILLVSRATVKSKQDTSIWTFEPSLKYLCLVQWLFKNLIFLCKYKIWIKTASSQAQWIINLYKHGSTPTVRSPSVVSCAKNHLNLLKTFLQIILSFLKPIWGSNFSLPEVFLTSSLSM